MYFTIYLYDMQACCKLYQLNLCIPGIISLQKIYSLQMALMIGAFEAFRKIVSSQNSKFKVI